MNEARDYDELNLLHVWRTIARRWRLVAMVCVAFTVLAVAGSYLIEPVYRADVLLAAPADSQSDRPLGDLMGEYGRLANFAGINLGGGSQQSMNESIEILRSRSFTERFIRQHDLLPVLFAERWDAQDKTWRSGPEGNRPPSMWKAYKKLNSARKINKDSKTGFVKLSIEWRHPALAAQWANDMVRMLNEHLRARAVEEAERSIAYLQAQLDQTMVVERRHMLIGLMETETRKIVFAKARTEYAVRTLDPAAKPEEKVRPQRAIIAVTALLVGLVIGSVIVLIRQSLAAEK